MTQATDLAGDRAQGAPVPSTAAAGLASSPSTAALLGSLSDLLNDVRWRSAAVGPSQVLVALGDGGPTCGADLAAALRLDQSTVSRHLSALAADGLIRRTPSAQDRRVHEVELTEAGLRQARAEAARRVAPLASSVADWSEDDIDTLARLLARFVAGIRATEEGTP